MIDKEQFPRLLQVICQQAWSVPTNTTMNAMIEYIVREALEQLILPELELLNADNLYLKEKLNLLEDLVETSIEGTLENASKDGGVSQPKRNPQASVKGSGKSPKAGTTNGT